MSSSGFIVSLLMIRITSYRLMKLGFPRSTYYAMKKGDNISTHTVNQLCKILKCNVSDIPEYIDEEK